MQGKKIILSVCGSIAAYKTAFLTRLLVKQGAEVQILMTDSASKFITPLTLSTLSKRPVYKSVTSEEGWNNHVELGLWADAMVIAPLTATSLGKLANGIADSMVVAAYLSARCPVFFAPAMDLDMWEHPSVKENVRKLQSYGNHLIPVEHGELASGLVGKGRMAEPENIVSFLNDFFKKEADFKGKKIILTAGPTYEPLDPVRFIGNRSTGKMGIAIADELANRGAEVHLVLGPSKLSPTNSMVKVSRVQTAQQMYEASIKVFPEADAAILTAAVADFRPKTVSDKKIKKKKGQEEMEIVLEKTPDIAASLGKIKKENQLLVGFALETNNGVEHAQGKLRRKNLDFIVLNSLSDKGAGFGFDTNKVTIIHSESYEGNKKQEYELKSKKNVAIDIANELILRMKQLDK